MAKRTEEIENASAPKKKWFAEIKKADYVAKNNYESFAPENCFKSPSHYLNWVTGNKANAFPFNSSKIYFGAPKSGKTFLCLSEIAEMHRTDPVGVAVYISTELRGQLQATNFPGIDQDRILIVDSNDAAEIGDDLINGQLKPQVQDGMPLRILCVDSVNGIQGTKRKNADSIEQHLIGDQALTIKNFLQIVVPWCKRNKIMLIGTAQLTANIDAGSHGPKEKMSASWATKHAFEYFISVKRAGAAEDKIDISGASFEEDIKDARGNKILNAHKVYVKMEESSIGPAGRSGVFTLSPTLGIINSYEEIFWLGKNTGVISTPNNRTYYFGDQSWNGKKEMAFAIRDNPELGEAILEEVRKLDDK